MNVKITVNGITQEAAPGTLLSSVLGHVDMPCGGHGRCGKCRVKVFGNVSAPSDRELHLLGDAAAEGIRLACMTRAEGDCTVLTEAAAPGQICTDGDMPAITLRPAFAHYGAAVDIGTTTLAARLYRADGACIAEATALNPQSAFGADVITRIEAALRGECTLADITRGAIDGLLAEMAEAAGIAAAEIDGLVITGNTVMLHLLTETSVEPLSHAPFEAARLFGETLTARELGLHAPSADAEVYLPPCIAAFIGADTTTALLASGLARSEETRLLADIGTNGEMVLYRNGGMLACSTAAGPAFEGAGISMGMGGKPGAVDHVRLEGGRLCAHVIGDVPPQGICGSGIVDAAACLVTTEVLDETGFLEDDEAVIAPPVVLTQEDIRKIQLAKSAIHAGIRTLLHTAGADVTEVRELLIAGGFGSYLDPVNAGKIGLLPAELTGRIRSIGNAALTGAAMLLLDRHLRSGTVQMTRGIRVVELAANPVFAAEYMERMMF